MFYFLLFITTIRAFNKLGDLRWSFALAKIPYSSIAKPVCIRICFVSIWFSLFIKPPFEELHRVLFILSAKSASQLKMIQTKINSFRVNTSSVWWLPKLVLRGDPLHVSYSTIKIIPCSKVIHTKHMPYFKAFYRKWWHSHVSKIFWAGL